MSRIQIYIRHLQSLAMAPCANKYDTAKIADDLILGIIKHSAFEGIKISVDDAEKIEVAFNSIRGYA